MLHKHVIDANSPNQFKNLLDRHFNDAMFDLYYINHLLDVQPRLIQNSQLGRFIAV